MSWGRKVAIVRFDKSHYGVQYRSNFLSSWKQVEDFGNKGHIAWTYETARFIADQVMTNGAVPGETWSGVCYPIIELDIEE